VVRFVGTGCSRHLPSKIVVGGLVAANILGFSAIQERFSLRGVERPIRWLAGMTFSLYLFHYPLLHLAGSALPGDPASPVRAALLSGLVLLAVAALASVTEKRKATARRAVDAIGRALQRGFEAVAR
jgi:peptidoglycan/LPS O-acetylase OafA/YrhL